MNRDIEHDLLRWKEDKNRMPILLRGARQVGKSFIVEKFGRAHFENIVVVNFELQPELISCFNTLQPHEILTTLSLSLHTKIVPGNTLLFLDEIQDCPHAIRALRYFKELLPELHIIGAGSLLEFTLNDADFRMPVGRVQSLYLKPLSFKEFLSAAGYQAWREFIEQADLTKEKPIPDSIHQELLKQVKNYLVLGGMPRVLQSYFASEEIALGGISRKYDFTAPELQQTILLSTYRQDFGKYARHSQIQYVQRVFEKAPGFISEHIKYSKIDPDARAQNIKSALVLLEQAGLIYPVYNTSASGIPLISLINEKKFKILFLDIGLMTRASHLAANVMLDENILLVNRGAIAEQFVGQELLAYAPRIDESELFFWCREQKSSMAEVDFVITVDSQIVPIEVKAGSTGQLKSLRIFMQEKSIKMGVRVSQHSLNFHDQILSVPIYMVGEIARLIKNIIK